VITVDLSILASHTVENTLTEKYLRYVDAYRHPTSERSSENLAECITAQAQAINAIHESRLRWIRGDA
jgi:HD superfamily phosphohydrolase